MARMLAVWCPDWPVVAAEIAEEVLAHAPVAVLAANRVVACSAAARAEGVRRGLRKREAQSRCPHLVVVSHDAARDARAFEPVVAAVEELAPGVEVIRPGLCVLVARGPAGYFGGEERAAERIVEHVAQACTVEGQVGVADGVFGAGLAARAGTIVPPGDTARFLSRVDVSVLDRPQLTDLLRRLGIRTLGDFAALPPADVLARFGFDAAFAHRLAAGSDARPLAVRRPPPDLDVTQTFDEPLDRVDAAAFAARALAQRLHDRLAAHGLACTLLGIEAVTAHGEELHRTWRHDGLLTAAAIADRVRWQLEGWLTRGRGQPKPTAGILRLRLLPDGVVAHVGLQPGLWGEAGEERDRAHRAFTRVQGLLGPDAVVTAVLGGGRSPADRVQLVPWGDDRGDDRRGRGGRGDGGRGDDLGDDRALARAAQPPWPGRLPAPEPATVLPQPLPAEVYAADGSPVGVTGRLEVSAAPGSVAMARAAPVDVVGWAGPWPVDERWWAPAEARRRVRFQVCLADGRALLMVLAAGQWAVEAVYD